MQIFDEKNDFFAENKRFFGLIKYYSYKLQSNTAEADLWGFLWLLLKNAKKPLNEKYIAVCLRNEYIRLSKNKFRYQNLNFEIVSPAIDVDLKNDIKKALFLLSKKEREVIIYYYFFGFSVAEIGLIYKNSRQAVNKIKNNALEKIRNFVIY